MISLRPTYLKRYAQIAHLLIKYGRSDVVDACELPKDYDDQHPPEANSGKPEEFARDLEELGPTFIKLGQLLSTRPDILPEPYLEALQDLQDDVEPVAVEEIREIIEGELGVRISKAFSEFDDTPLATASLGQVHRAVLRSGGDVAVKVIRPGIRDDIVDDLAAIKELAQALDNTTAFGRRYGFLGIAESLETTMLREVDLTNEVQAAHAIGNNMRPFQRFIIPAPIDDYCSESVLTMGYVSGTKITDVSPTVLLEIDRRGLAEEIFDAYLKQVLVDGIFHADPHPGNLLLTRTHAIGLLDCGMVVYVDPDTRSRMIRLLMAIADARGEDAATAIESLGDKRDDYDAHGFRTEIGRIVMRNQDQSVDGMQVGRALMQIQGAAGQAGLKIRHEVRMLGKTLMNLDRVVALLDPDFDPNAALRDKASELMQKHTQHDISLTRLFQSALETTDLLQKLPNRLNRITEMIADNQIHVKVDAIDEDHLVRGLQNIANRITVGVLLAAIIIGAALMMRIDAQWKLFGYPGIAMVFFLLAAVAGLILIARIAFSSHKSD